MLEEIRRWRSVAPLIRPRSLGRPPTREKAGTRPVTSPCLPEKLQPSVTCALPSVGIGLMSSQKVQTPPNTSRSRFGGPWNVTSNPPQCFDPSNSWPHSFTCFDVPPCALHAQIAVAVAIDFAGHLAGKLLEDECEGAIGRFLDGQRPPAGFPFAHRVDGPDGKAVVEHNSAALAASQRLTMRNSPERKPHREASFREVNCVSATPLFPPPFPKLPTPPAIFSSTPFIPPRQCSLVNRRRAMDWNAAIEKHSEALKRIVVTLFAMAGLDARGQVFPQDSAPQDVAPAEKPTLPRHLYRAILRVLRPADIRRAAADHRCGARHCFTPTRVTRYPNQEGHSREQFTFFPPESPCSLPDRALERKEVKCPQHSPQRPLTLPLFDRLPLPSRPRRSASTSVPRIWCPATPCPFPFRFATCLRPTT